MARLIKHIICSNNVLIFEQHNYWPARDSLSLLTNSNQTMSKMRVCNIKG